MTSPSFKSITIRLCLALAAAISVAAQQKQVETLSKRERRQKLYPDLVGTFDLAEQAPAALRALALLRIATALANKDEEWKRELLEEAFEAAAQSPLRWSVAYVEPQGPMLGGLPQRILKALEINSGLDHLTLQTAVVRSMLAVDKPESLNLFNRIAPLGLSPLTCSDSLIPNVEAYYRTASQLAKDGFSQTQQKRKERLEFLRVLAGSITSSTEVGPAAQMLLDQHLPSNEAGVLAATLGQQLTTLQWIADPSPTTWIPRAKT